MLKYCEQDVVVNTDVYLMFEKQLVGFTNYCVDLEMDIATYIVEQQWNGWTFDMKAAQLLEAELLEKMQELEEEVSKTFKPLPTFKDTVQPRVLKNGELSSVGLKFLKDTSCINLPTFIEKNGRVYTSGPFTRVDWIDFNLGSRQQIAEQLLHRGWKPTSTTEKGNIIINEPVLESIRGTFPEATLLADYFMVSKRLSMVVNWISAYNEKTGRLHGYVNTLGAVTARMTHSGPNLAQVPATKSDKDGKVLWGFKGSYGADCRALFTVPKGYTQVGCDASGLELRCLAHYMNDEDYTYQILNGDIHTLNQIAAGLSTRNQAKTFIYAFLYGGGDAKIGSIVGGSSKEGKKLKESFLKNTPALKTLRENVLLAAERGWLKGIDGRKIRVRSAHAALNSLLQSCGAIIMKVFLRLVMIKARELNLDFKLNGNIHDEIQVEVLNKDVEKFKKICLESMIEAGQELKLRCPLAGDVKTGTNWADTH